MLRKTSSNLVFVLLLVLAPSLALAQGTLFVEGDKVGVGVQLPSTTLHVQKADGSTKLLIEETSGTTALRELFQLSNNGGPFFIFSDTSNGTSYSFAMSGVGDFIISQQQNPGVEFRLTPSGNMTIAGTLTQGSSRDIKTAIEPVNGSDILQRVVDLPLSTWTYTADEKGSRHLGPMAEDFKEAFALGSSPKGLSTMDTSGVALAAIQGLYDLVEQQNRQIQALQQRIDEMEGASPTTGDAEPHQ